jgi:hypothetical protein
MCAQYVKRVVALILMLAHVMLAAGDIYAEALSVSLRANPEVAEVAVGADPIALIAKATGAALQFRWELQGLGKIEGSGSAIFYYAPQTIEGQSARTMVTVIVTDQSGQEARETYTFTILAPEAEEIAETTVVPAPEKTGMSRNTKIAIGAGAAAAAVGAAVLLWPDENNDDKPPFTGKFHRAYLTTTETGEPVSVTDTLDLKQNNTTISGTFRSANTLVNCCTATIQSPVSGTANGLSAYLTWGGGEARCQCAEWTFTVTLPPVEATATLINNESTLRFEGGAELLRLSVTGRSGGQADTSLPITGDFIRQ